jgi:damage-control phosphatase, subfamily I
MRTQLDCIPCFVRQTLEAARHAAPGDEALHHRVLSRTCAAIPTFSDDASPPMMGEIIHGIIREETGVDDPYAEIKRKNVRRALALVPRLERFAVESRDRLEAAIRLAIAGNAIDLGANPDFDLEEELCRLEEQTPVLSDLPALREALGQSNRVLYIGDNTAEAIFDRFLIRELHPRRVFFAVRTRPIINDITEVEAREIGMHQLATIVDSGSPLPGTDLSRATPEFKRLFDETPVVIAKGQGNFETLSDCGRSIFFLLKVKCPVVAQMTGMPEGNPVLVRGGSRDRVTVE